MTFIGDFETVDSMHECEFLPPEVLAENPSIPTFTRTFRNFI